MKKRLARKQRRAAQLAQRKLWKQQGYPITGPDRTGSVIVVVIALLSALMFLGFVFFSLASQENENAEYFKEASKKIEPIELDPNEIFDCFLEQLILGAPDHKYNSMFWGGRVSLLPTMYGTDATPFNGEGTHVIWDSVNNVPIVDRDRNNMADADQNPLQINMSPGAQLASGADATMFNLVSGGLSLPDPDVNYLYPDHNFPMLSYVGWSHDTDSGTNPNGRNLVVIPAGHRPGLLRSETNWYSNANTLPYVLRPHTQKLAVASNGIVSDLPRYIGAFFSGQQDIVTSTDEGVWGDIQDARAGHYQYDADPTGRGVADSVYLDCGFPIQTDPGTGQQFVPMIAAHIIDGESLINLNVAGNNNEYLVRPGGSTISNIPTTQSLSRSNLGVSRSEINPIWALLTDSSGASAAELQPYVDYFGSAPAAATPAHLANMELWSLLHGRAEIVGGAVDQVYPGRWGEQTLVGSAWSGGGAVSSFPRAGVTGTEAAADDNGNLNEGIVATDAFNLVNPHPIDLYGVGTIEDGANSYQRFLRSDINNNDMNYLGRMAFPGYENYVFNSYSGVAVDPRLFPYQQLFSNYLTPNSTVNRRVWDEPEEMVVDSRMTPFYANDSAFSDPAVASLQLTRTDLNQIGFSSILEDLAPYTFTDAPDEEEIRSRFTTLSYKMLTNGVAHNRITATATPVRAWEWKSVGSLANVFPPTLGSATIANPQPFRSETFELLFTPSGDPTYRTLKRKLSVNGVLDRIDDGDPTTVDPLRVRPLTDHPINLMSNAPIIAPSVTSPPATWASIAQQEAFARYDRQRLCRDIYTMLYLFGGANDSFDYLTNPSPYSNEECREMAQFAVNLVDRMDTDDVITMFQYDTNLADGWLGGGQGIAVDYPYPPDHSSNNYVYGVEEQTLCFNEALAVVAPRVENSDSTPNNYTDHQGTEWNDQFNSQFLYVEMQNVSPRSVNVNDGTWELVIRPVKWSGSFDPTTQGVPIGEERRVVFRSSSPASVGVGDEANRTDGMGTMIPGSLFSVGMFGSDSADAADFRFPAGAFPTDTVADGTQYGPSRFKVDPDFVPDTGMGQTGGTNNTPTRISPFYEIDDTQNINYLDLLREDTEYDVYESTGNNVDDGDEALTSSGLPSGVPDGAAAFNLDHTTLDLNEVNMVELVLRRRANRYRTQPTATNEGQSRDNPWIEVDRMLVNLQEFVLNDDDDDGNAIETQLQTLRSSSRHQPLYGRPNRDPAAPSIDDSTKQDVYDATTYLANTIGEVNEDRPEDPANTPIPYALWHPHFNRPFTSIGEVLEVPLFGSDRLQVLEDPVSTNALAPEDWRNLTTRLADRVGTLTLQNGRNVPDLRLTGENIDGFSTFGKMALNPWGEDQMSNNMDDNRWYRLLELIEVPSRMHWMVEPVPGRQWLGNVNDTQTDLYRDPGVLNLNTINEGVKLQAMLDDVDVASIGGVPTTNPAANGITALTDAGGNGGYDWWRKYLLSRDGTDDPIHPGTGPLPGVPGINKPFRPLSYVGSDGANSIQETILRTNPFDTAAGEKRQLFELGTFAQVDTPARTQDYAFKNRLLSKVMNHSTTQSNTFIVFLQIDYFEAQEVIDGNGNLVTQIGQKLPNSPGYRGFFVIDRSLAHELITPGDIPDRTSARTFSFNPNFNWRALIRHRQRLN